MLRVNPAAICSIRYGNGSIPLSVVTLLKRPCLYAACYQVQATRVTVPDPVPDPFQTCSRHSGAICHQVHMHSSYASYAARHAAEEAFKEVPYRTAARP